MKNGTGVKSVDSTSVVPWYLGRKFWGVLVVVLVLVNIIIYWVRSDIFFYWAGDKILNKIFIAFYNPAYSFDFITTKHFLYKNIGNWMVVIYYILLGIPAYLTFKKKRVKIKYPLTLLILIIITMLGTISNFVSWI